MSLSYACLLLVLSCFSCFSPPPLAHCCFLLHCGNRHLDLSFTFSSPRHTIVFIVFLRVPLCSSTYNIYTSIFSWPTKSTIEHTCS
ncbi:MAG: hypothetical protein J3R72DRAFT_213741 [Linnemannia gamsii]|nr:MAG: hypothetical protein J3R72DRAFT_213741 [Linnemannia gamsii]